MSDPNCLEGRGRTPDEMAENLRKLDAVAPTAAEKFALMFGHPRTTPETDAMASMFRTHQEWCSHSTMLERQRDELMDALQRIDPFPSDEIQESWNGNTVYCEITVADIRLIRAAIAKVKNGKHEN